MPIPALAPAERPEDAEDDADDVDEDIVLVAVVVELDVLVAVAKLRPLTWTAHTVTPPAVPTTTSVLEGA